MNNILGNMPPVVKNILILNVIMYIITMLGEAQGIPMTYLLGGYVFNSPYFEPFQMVSHFFMHGGFFHILFNMFALVIFGSALEQVWGPKRFFIFYIVTALGAFFLHQIVGYLEVKNIEDQLIAAGYDLYSLQEKITELRSGDRKSTRLNSSHVRISYAVFCLKKKNIKSPIQLTAIKKDK